VIYGLIYLLSWLLQRCTVSQLKEDEMLALKETNPVV
jgi:YNFM family putative membrane transporter